MTKRFMVIRWTPVSRDQELALLAVKAKKNVPFCVFEGTFIGVGSFNWETEVLSNMLKRQGLVNFVTTDKDASGRRYAYELSKFPVIRPAVQGEFKDLFSRYDFQVQGSWVKFVKKEIPVVQEEPSVQEEIAVEQPVMPQKEAKQAGVDLGPVCRIKSDMEPLKGSVKQMNYCVYGFLAMKYGGKKLKLQVLKSGAGFYLGTMAKSEGDSCVMPFTRESEEYWATEPEARAALKVCGFTQRVNP